MSAENDKVELELLSKEQQDLYLFFEAAKRGGLSTISKQHVEARQKTGILHEPQCGGGSEGQSTGSGGGSGGTKIISAVAQVSNFGVARCWEKTRKLIMCTGGEATIKLRTSLRRWATVGFRLW